MDRKKEEVEQFFHLRNDYVFKRVFKTEDTYALHFLINSVVQHKVQHLTLMSEESLSNKRQDKRIYQDIKSKDEDGNIYNVEMQNGFINSSQEDRFLFTGCKCITGQLYAGDEYSQLNRTETIVFSSGRYDDKLLVDNEMASLRVGRAMNNKKLFIYFISLPVIEEIVATKAKTGEELTDLEVLCLAIWEGFTEKVYEMANKEQRKVLKIMENTLNSLYEDPMELTAAEERYFYKLDLQERERLGKMEGIAVGRSEGITIGEKKNIIKILSSKFNGLSGQIEKAIMDASAEVIDQISMNLFDLKDENDLVNILHSLSEKDC